MDMAETVEHDESDVIAPDLSHLITEDDAPVDNRYSERQMRLLTSPLFESWEERKPFEALTDVGFFSKPDNESVVAPDFLLSLGVEPKEINEKKETHSYFIWLYGKPPNLVIEIVSNKKGGELDRKYDIYQNIGVAYYAVHDPYHHLGKRTLRLFRLVAGKYVECASAQWMPEIGLGLALWEGIFQDAKAEWLRFVDKDGQVIPTGAETASEADARATEATSRANEAEIEVERLRRKLNELGIEE
jgi:Uma2 family endonuclease